MKDGFRVYDTDTHVNPAAEVIDRYVDPDFRPRLQELAPYRTPCGNRRDRRTRIAPARNIYRRVLGEAAPRESFTGRDTGWMGSKEPRPGAQDDHAANRVVDMDDEGTDVHFLFPASGQPDRRRRRLARNRDDPRLPSPHGGFLRAVSGPAEGTDRRLDARCREAVREIREWGKSKWAVAVMPLVDKECPADHPSLDPIWRAGAEYGLPIVHHSSPGTRPITRAIDDMWDNIFLGRLASHPWGAMRFVAAFIGGGILDRYPYTALRHARMRLRLAAVLGQAHGRAVRLCRLDRRIEDEAKRIYEERALFLQHRAAGRGGHVRGW